MSYPFTNIHTHVFNSVCAPDRFLMIIPSKFLRGQSTKVKWALDTKIGRWVIVGLLRLSNNRKSPVIKKTNKYLSFLDVGTDATQQKVFETAFEVSRNYDSSSRIVGLTLNMQYMDSLPSKRQITFETQLDQVKEIKRYYPKNFFPFLGIDPRHKSGRDLVTWAKKYFESGVVTKEGKVLPYFCGIKLYPALGFFPFDPRLDELYKYAEENNIPVMTHCTRTGSQYIGSEIQALIPRTPPMIMPSGNANVKSTSAQKSIYDRIARYYTLGWIKNSLIGDNDLACDLFGHPENYIPLLEKYPKLRICLAHMGGSSEIARNPEGDKELYRKLMSNEGDGVNWFEKIQEMMKEYPSMYTDVSYTLSDLDNEVVLGSIIQFLDVPDSNGKVLGERVLFGTDFFMTEQEKGEADLYKLALEKLGNRFTLMAGENNQRYLMQPL